MVCIRVRRCLRLGVRLRIPARRVAVRTGGSGLVCGCFAPLAAKEQIRGEVSIAAPRGLC